MNKTKRKKRLLRWEKYVMNNTTDYFGSSVSSKEDVKRVIDWYNSIKLLTIDHATKNGDYTCKIYGRYDKKGTLHVDKVIQYKGGEK